MIEKIIFKLICIIEQLITFLPNNPPPNTDNGRIVPIAKNDESCAIGNKEGQL